MKMFITQFYIDPTAVYPLTSIFQQYVTERLNQLVSIPPAFISRFGEDWSFVFRMSAKAELIAPDIRGPAVYKRYKNVEYTIFLPFDQSVSLSRDVLSNALRVLLSCIAKALDDCGMDTGKLRAESEAIVSHIMNSPKMIKEETLRFQYRH